MKWMTTSILMFFIDFVTEKTLENGKELDKQAKDLRFFAKLLDLIIIDF